MNNLIKDSKLHSLWYITDHSGALSAILHKGKYKKHMVQSPTAALQLVRRLHPIALFIPASFPGCVFYCLCCCHGSITQIPEFQLKHCELLLTRSRTTSLSGQRLQGHIIHRSSWTNLLWATFMCTQINVFFTSSVILHFFVITQC